MMKHPRSARQFLSAAALAMLVCAPGAARAQAAPVPVGHWATSPAVEELYVNGNGTCAFMARGRVQVQGRCTWNPSSRGGILTIIYPMPREPGKVRYNIVWINPQTISVWGDIFYRR